MKTVHSIEQFRQVYLPEYNERRRERRERLARDGWGRCG